MSETSAVPATPSSATSPAPPSGRRGRTGTAALSRAERRAIGLQVAAALVWVPQAGLLAHAVAGIADGAGMSAALLPALGLVLLGILRAGLDAAGGRLAFRFARAELSRLRAQAAHALMRRSPVDAGRATSGLAASVLAEQAEAVVPYLARFRPARFKATCVPLVLLAFVLPVSWAAAFVLAFAAPFIPLFMALIGWRAKEASEAQLVEVGGMNAFLLDRLRGLATIRGLGAVDATARRLRADAESLRRRTMVVLRIAFMSSAVLELFSAVAVAMVAAYIGLHLLGSLDFGSWGHRFGLGEGLFVLLLAPAFFDPLRELAAAWHDRAAGQAALAALEQLAEPGRPVVGGDVPVAPVPAGGGAPALALESVSFRHAGTDAAVFDGFDLTVAPGEHVALFAPSGAGKSTLLALLAGLAAPEAGRILIDGEVLTALSADRLRARMAYIGQQPHIFAGTLGSNVALGRPEVDAPAIGVAIRAARLERVADARGPAPIGEGGRGLSGGEGLRLALARLAAAPSAGLILADEPTAHLDSGTAGEITEALLELARGRTLVVATHDPVLAARMDRIIRLAPNGEIAP
ncbi:thiol reductant ABC exporter subunit CydD [Ancylobacter amanitiformis]|uniref:ATP-binding cassette subfamily C protein CydD n=1 Tax=Ancylobacter amanitiformis TaxID=217069 RepID=A0ABU0LMM8_9HYPH|nr:thiol reductant ABC exporter subunit CydD [Ancylobacter amanitiformis]MDQ0509863.1 ATP-binding cassette subfamily C protein CydD [Ancylobacter amanitiformis]